MQLKLAFLFSVTLALTGCGKPYGGAVDTTPSAGDLNISGAETRPDESSLLAGKELYQAQCKACHGDATTKAISGNMLRVGSHLTSRDAYITYIAATMPPTDKTQCDADCAALVFDYAYHELLADMAANGGNNSGNNNGADVNSTGAELYAAQCETCHGNASKTGPYGSMFLNNSPLTDRAAYIAYITQYMPAANASACDADCAAAVFDYAVIALPNAFNGNNNSGDTNSGSGSGTAVTLLPVAALNAVAEGNNAINLSWSDPGNDEKGFSIERRVNDGQYEEIMRLALNINALRDANLTPGNRYRYRIRAFVGTEFSAYSNSQEITLALPQTAPAAPSALAGSSTESQISLTWQDNSNNETAFIIERRSGSAAFAQIASLAANTTTYNNLQVSANTLYDYRVSASNANGTSASVSISGLQLKAASSCTSSSSSAPQYVAGTTYQVGDKVLNQSNIYQCTVGGWCSSNASSYYAPGSGLAWQDAWKLVGAASSSSGSCATTTIPAAASNLNAVLSSDQSSIALSWTDNAQDESGYLLQRKVNSGSWSNLQELAAGATTYRDAAISVGSTYQYRVAAFNSAGSSAYVQSTSLLVEQKEIIPATPTNMLATPMLSSIVLSWEDNAGNEANYLLERRVDNGSWALLATLNPNSQSYNDTGVATGKRYDYRVSAKNSAGTSMTASIFGLSLASAPVADARESAFNSKCVNCHVAGGLGGELNDSRIKSKWNGKSFDAFMVKVKTMPVASCDTTCLENAASHIWETLWGYTRSTANNADGRGVRGIRLLTAFEYQNAVKDLTGVSVSAENLPKSRFDEHFKYASDADNGKVQYDEANKYLQQANSIAAAANLSLLGCGSSSCSSSQVATAGLRVLRRPLSSSELSTYSSINSANGSRAMLASMLLSPYFLYHIELGTWNSTAQAYQLTQYEIASALSFQILGTTPSAALLNKAASNTFSSSAAIASEADALMSGSAFNKNMLEFVRYYSKTYEAPVPKTGLSQSVIDAMLAEQNSFVGQWLIDGGNFDKLFSPGYTYANSTLASHYGLSVTGSSMQKISTDRNRGGLLHLGITQIINSDFAATSLVKRGKMIRENMLCHTMGVPVGVDPATITLPSNPMTTRERWNYITGPDASGGQCWKCHQLMNEPGVALESFDAAGRFRTQEEAYNLKGVMLAIDASGILRDNTGTQQLGTFNDARDLANFLGQSNEAQNCFVNNYYRFATGHRPDSQNQDDLVSLQSGFGANNSVKNLIRNHVASAGFMYRVDR
ncbi:MAG: DUF1588 domain-containing protein [Oceanospirillaceae bacterium]|nr:DUF1588 domain-containing protein [Oceanospirillaceae bacterium]